MPWLEQVVEVYHSNPAWHQDDVDVLVKTSLSLMCDTIISKGPSEVSNRAMELLLKLDGGLRLQCAVGRCQLQVPLEGLEVARCADDHVLPRCCVTLLPVLRPETCQLCNSVLHREPADMLCGREALCPLCGGIMESTTVRRASSTARVAAQGAAMLPKVPIVVLNTRSRKGKTGSSADKI
ncbi:uncharacterized protein LOC125178570 [Hyalella azteca]|uniref:Uncharacterized protein LOC125178570 n=1 Tax=Hyalella azteca TaxID=294128 RepID=A0A979FPQ8_HYAAZ|nr:uncharacterized protein LOC125178570 [Hyalella azteca]